LVIFHAFAYYKPLWVDLHKIWFWVAVADVITCDKFGDWSREVENQWFPQTKPVAVNTLLPLPSSEFL